jgi:hypothetical protein
LYGNDFSLCYNMKRLCLKVSPWIKLQLLKSLRLRGPTQQHIHTIKCFSHLLRFVRILKIKKDSPNHNSKLTNKFKRLKKGSLLFVLDVDELTLPFDRL